MNQSLKLWHALKKFVALRLQPGPKNFSLRKWPLFLGKKNRGLLLGIFRGRMPPGSPNPDPISGEKMSFFAPFFRPGLYEIMSSLLRLESNIKDFLKSISNSHISLSFSLIWNWSYYKYDHTLRSSLENHTRFQTEMGKVYTHFQTKSAQKKHTL